MAQASASTNADSYQKRIQGLIAKNAHIMSIAQDAIAGKAVETAKTAQKAKPLIPKKTVALVE